MDNDDQMIGRILSRREVLKLLGAAGATLLVGCGATTSTSTAPTAQLNAEAATAATLDSPTAQATQVAELATAEAANTAVAGQSAAMPACVVRPEVTEGPYYVDLDLIRSDIRADTASGEVQQGAPLVLTFNVSQVTDGSCTTFAGATVDIWHCNALGDYSGVSDPGFQTTGQNWLRGSQVTDANGVATFTTIYPGWYPGRAVHIHFKVRPNDTQEFTSQLFFDDALSQQVFAEAPYASNGSVQGTLNSVDNIYQDLLLLTTTRTADGYAATFPIGIDLSTIGTGSSGGGPGGGGPPR